MKYENIISNTMSQGGYWNINKPLARAIRLKYNSITYAASQRI